MAPALAGAAAREHVGQPVAEEDVVAEDQRRRVAADEIGADDEGLREPFGLRLHRVGELNAQGVPSPSSALESGIPAAS